MRPIGPSGIWGFSRRGLGCLSCRPCSEDASKGADHFKKCSARNSLRYTMYFVVRSLAPDFYYNWTLAYFVQSHV